MKKKLNVLLVGGGGRECALAWKISQSDVLRGLYVTHENPGFPVDVTPLLGDWVRAALENQVDLVVVGPEAPLADGLADRMRAVGIAVFGPTQKAAQLESSKAFSKDFMARNNIPTASYGVFTDAESAKSYTNGPCVVKADGLAGGKGVYVCDSAEDAQEAIDALFKGRFGPAGAKVVIEERLVGPELSVIAICDGQKAIPLMPCRDHKRRFDGGLGPNTGGMGAVCPPQGLEDGLLKVVYETVLQPTVEAMAAEGMPFVGALYAGLMLTKQGPKTLEFNVRFGDPECQPLMMMLDEDILPLLYGAAVGALSDRYIKWKSGAACCVVVCAKSYPEQGSKGKPIVGLPPAADELRVFLSGAAIRDDQLVTNGGRVLSVCSIDKDLSSAQQKAYEGISQVNFVDMDFRTDIGA